MAKNKVLLIDADVISHFIATGRIDTLTAILAPHAVYVVDNVYKEATWHPTDFQRKAKVDAWMTRCKVSRIGFPYTNDHVKKEFFRLKKESPLLGEGERACMSMARFGHEVVASSNFRDVADYCDAFGIEYIGTLDILAIALNKGIYTQEDCNNFIADAVSLNKARFPVSDITHYTPTRDLNDF